MRGQSCFGVKIMGEWEWKEKKKLRVQGHLLPNFLCKYKPMKGDMLVKKPQASGSAWLGALPSASCEHQQILVFAIVVIVVIVLWLTQVGPNIAQARLPGQRKNLKKVKGVHLKVGQRLYETRLNEELCRSEWGRFLVQRRQFYWWYKVYKGNVRGLGYMPGRLRLEYKIWETEV